MSILQPYDRVFHLERDVGTIRAIGDRVAWVGQMLAVRFDKPDSDGGCEALVPESDLERVQ